MKKQITKVEPRPITEHRVTKTTRKFGRRLLTAALNGIWWTDGDENSKSVAEFINIGMSGDRKLRQKYNIATLSSNVAADGNYADYLEKQTTNELIEVEGTEHEWPIIGYEDVTYSRYKVDVRGYEKWYRANTPGGVWMLDESKPYCWVEEIDGVYALNVSFDGGSGVGRMPARFLTPVCE